MENCNCNYNNAHDCGDLMQTSKLFNRMCNVFLIQSIISKIEDVFKRIIEKNNFSKTVYKDKSNNALICFDAIRYVMCDYHHYVVDVDKTIKEGLIKSNNSCFLFYLLGLNRSNINKDNNNTSYADWYNWCLNNDIDPDKELIDVASIPGDFNLCNNNNYDNLADNKYKCDIRYTDAWNLYHLEDSSKFGAEFGTSDIHDLLSIYTYLIRDIGDTVYRDRSFEIEIKLD